VNIIKKPHIKIIRSCFLIIFIFAFSANKSYTQDFQCGNTFSADPFFDEQAFEQFKSNYLRNRLNRNDDLITLPIRISIVRHNDGTGGFDESQIENVVKDLNVAYQNLNIQFTLCGGVGYLDKNEFYDFDRNIYQDDLVTFNEEKVINIYFINKVFSTSSQICGYSSFPWSDNSYLVVQNNCVNNGSTFAHELGHFLGLYHTHSTSEGEELVDGTNCIFTGDLLCETPADPRLGTSTVNSECEYTGNAKDLNNDVYKPNPRNIMSYSRKSCRDEFSEEQKIRMRFYYEREYTELVCNETTSTSGPNVNTLLSIFPNPSNHSIHLTWKNTDWRPELIILSNILGQRIESYLPTVNSFDVSQLPKGIYYLSFQKDGYLLSKKIIVTP